MENLKDLDKSNRTTLLITIGCIGTTINVLSIVFNVTLIVCVVKGKHIYHSPFYYAGFHLLLSEVLVNLFTMILVSPCLLSPDVYAWYYAERKDTLQYVLLNSMLMGAHDFYYFMQTLIAFYRFFSVHSSPRYHELFSGRKFHVYAVVAWIWCSAESIYMVFGQCTKLYRPMLHFIGVYCTTYYGSLPTFPVRWYVIVIFQVFDIINPGLAMLIYVALFVKIQYYRLKARRAATETGISKGVDPKRKRFSLVYQIFKQCDDPTTRSHLRIVYQGVLLAVFLSFEPLVNVIWRSTDRTYRPREETWYLIIAYCIIYMACTANFLVFFVFNPTTRKDVIGCVRSWCGIRAAKWPEVVTVNPAA